MDIGMPSGRLIGGRCIVVLFEISTVCVEIKGLYKFCSNSSSIFPRRFNNSCIFC